MSPSPATTSPPAASARSATAASTKAEARPKPRWKRRRDGGFSLNLTPMIDVVFLLLFFFLVVTRFGTREGTLPADLPRKLGGQSIEVPRVPIAIRFQADPDDADTCQVTIDRLHDQPISVAALLSELQRIKAEAAGFDDADTPIHLYPREGVRWDHVVNAYNAGLAAGYEKIYFVE